MNSLTSILNYVNDNIYTPNGLSISDIKSEPQNSDYAAAIFRLTSELTVKKVRFRVAKITPTKVGQFVTFWEKDNNGNNQAYQYDEAPDLLVITVFKNANFEANDYYGAFGQFVFPKDILIKKGILRSDLAKGKMGMRVYPSWDNPTSAAALKTQQWQLEYFFAVTDINLLPVEKITALYK